MCTLWRFKWTLLLLFMFLMTEVAANRSPDPPPQFYHRNWPDHYINDFAIDSSTFDNEKSISEKGNALFDEKIAAERILQDLFQANDVEIPAAEEGRQQNLPWLGSWLFAKSIQHRMLKQQQQISEYKQAQRQLPQVQYSRPEQQTQTLWHLYRKQRQHANIFVYKKSPEILPDEEEQNSYEADVNANDITVANTNAEDIEKGDTILDTLSEYNYNSDRKPIIERFNNYRTPYTKSIPFARERRLDYAYIPYTAYKNEQERKLNEANKLTFKRNKTANGDRRNFLPSISPAAMAHLGDFFTGLSNNVHYNEKTQPLVHPQAKLLEGQHPLRQLQEKITGDPEANAEFLHAIRTYRPSQKIRSLISMNPRGYHGAEFIDPNYMWVGLGK